MVVISDWSDLVEKCPISLERVKYYYEQFYTYLPAKIELDNLDKAKENLFIARGYLDSMFSTLVQILYDREILEKEEDKILFAWLIDNLGRYLKRIDTKEFDLLIKHDSPINERSNVGLSRVSAYWKLLQTSVDSLIYETLSKATKEYLEIPKENQEKRKFLYIFFQILNVTMAIMGGLAREETMGKKGMIQTIPTTWQSLMKPSGAGIIKNGYKEETGIDVDEWAKDLGELGGEIDEEKDE